ncbi:ribonuclease Z [Candidatus Woesearchaeota archaeon]|nr:ribonuclease Z [Candidatus Woesearchaeota archaeon]
MDIVFLGTSAMVPTKERNHSGILIRLGTEDVLVDCGEGTQRQLKLAGVKFSKIKKILISHWHGDHVLGLPGLIQSMGASEYNETLEIYGPIGTKKNIKKVFGIFGNKNMKMVVKEISSGKFLENEKYCFKCVQLKHNVSCLGYSITEKDKRKIKLKEIKKLGIPLGPRIGTLQLGKNIFWKGKKILSKDVSSLIKGKKITIISDTAPNEKLVSFCGNSDVLVCESTYGLDEIKKAKEHFHMTSTQAAELGKLSKTKKLVLTHFSARYKITKQLEKEAKKIFPKTVCASDFMEIKS